MLKLYSSLQYVTDKRLCVPFFISYIYKAWRQRYSQKVEECAENVVWSSPKVALAPCSVAPCDSCERSSTATCDVEFEFWMGGMNVKARAVNPLSKLVSANSTCSGD